MASIEGLTAEHCRKLAGAELSDIVVVQSYPLLNEDEDDDVASEIESEGAEGGEEEATAEVEDEDDDEELPTAEREVDQDDDESSVDEAGDDVNEENSEHEVEMNEDATATNKIYIVEDLEKDEDGSITDITLRELTYCLKPADATNGSFHIYGPAVQVWTTSTKPFASTEDDEISFWEKQSPDDEQMTDIKDAIITERFFHRIRLNPSGDKIRKIFFNGRCPANCNDGWMNTQEEMHLLVSESLRFVSEYRPVCPVCIGKALTCTLQTLRETFDDTYQPNLTQIIDFYGELAVRRKELGYTFKQFDEREWGMEFDDMISEDEDEGQPNGVHWQQWDEANDPNANPEFHPASDAAIAALPQKNFSDISTVAEARCLICNEEFGEESVIVELQCSHYFDFTCAETWLKQSNSCPTCRRKIPAVETDLAEVEEIKKTGPDEVSGEARLNEYLLEDRVATPGAESDVKDMSSYAVEMDGEDMMMSDIEHGAVATPGVGSD